MHMKNVFSWRIYGKNNIASLIKPSKIPELLSQQVMIMPNEVAVILHNNKVEEIVTPREIKKIDDENFLVNKIKSISDSRHKIDILIIDTSVKDINFLYNFNVNGDETISYEFQIRFRVDENKIPQLLTIMMPTFVDKKFTGLSVWDIFKKLDMDLYQVLQKVIYKYGLALISNQKLQEKFKIDAHKALRQPFKAWGFSLEALSFGISDLSDRVRKKEEIFELEKQAFKRLKPDLLKTHLGQYVVVGKEKAVLFGHNKTELAKQAYHQFGYVPLYIGLVEEGPEVVFVPTPRLLRQGT